jgi:hypothetical protein
MPRAYNSLVSTFLLPPPCPLHLYVQNPGGSIGSASCGGDDTLHDMDLSVSILLKSVKGIRLRGVNR